MTSKPEDDGVAESLARYFSWTDPCPILFPISNTITRKFLDSSSDLQGLCGLSGPSAMRNLSWTLDPSLPPGWHLHQPHRDQLSGAAAWWMDYVVSIQSPKSNALEDVVLSFHYHRLPVGTRTMDASGKSPSAFCQHSAHAAALPCVLLPHSGLQRRLGSFCAQRGFL
jgi:hypothetical protein